MRYKYRGYWIVIEKDELNEYSVWIWICGHAENKEIVGNNVFSLSMAQANAENHIDKVLSIGGILE